MPTTEESNENSKLLRKFPGKISTDALPETLGLTQEEFHTIFLSGWKYRLFRWIALNSTLEKLFLFPILTQTAITDIGNNRCIDKRRWPTNRAIPLLRKSTLDKVAFTLGLLQGTSFLTKKVWSAFLLSVIVNEIIEYFRLGSSGIISPSTGESWALWRIITAQFSPNDPFYNQLNAMKLLVSHGDTVVWPWVVGMPIGLGIMIGVLKWMQVRDLSKEIFNILNENIEIHPDRNPFRILKWLKPTGNIHSILFNMEHLLLWDNRLTSGQRDQLFLLHLQQLKTSSCIFNFQNISLLANTADGISIEDYKILLDYEIDHDKVGSILRTQINALNTLHIIASSKEKNITLPSSTFWRIYSKYLLWKIGRTPKTIYPLLPFFFIHILYQWYANISLLVALYSGITQTISFLIQKINCEYRQRKVWQYFDFLQKYNCTVCGDLPIPYSNTWTSVDCLTSYLLVKQQVNQIVALLNRLNTSEILSIDLSAQGNLSDKSLSTLLTAIKTNIPRLQTLVISNAYDLSYFNTSLDHPWEPLPRPQTTQHTHYTITIEGIKAISEYLKNSSITTLDLSFRHIQSEGIELLSTALSHPIRELIIPGNNISDSGCLPLSYALNNSKITRLVLSYNNITDEGLNYLFCRLAPKLTSLNLDGNNISDRAFQESSHALKNSYIQSLSFENNNISAEGMKYFSRVLPYTNINWLKLDYNTIGDQGADYLAASLPKVNSLSYLAVSSNNITQLGGKAMGHAIANGSKITILRLNTNPLGDTGVIYIAQALPLSQIQQLSIENSNFSKHGLDALAHTLSNSSVLELLISANPIGDDGIVVFSSFLNRMTKLKSLRASFLNLQSEGSKTLITSLKNSTLDYLDISFCNLANGGSAMTAMLKYSNLSHINIGSSNLSDAGLIEFTRSLPLSKISFLGLTANKLTDNSMRALAPIISKTTVQQIYLGLNHIGPSGAEILAKGLHDSQVQLLILDKNNIYDDGAFAISQALVSKKDNKLSFWFNTIFNLPTKPYPKPASPLQTLSLENISISDRGAKALCKTIPFTYISGVLGKTPSTRTLNIRNNPEISADVLRHCGISSSAQRAQPLWIFYTLWYLSHKPYNLLIKISQMNCDAFTHSSPTKTSLIDSRKNSKESINHGIDFCLILIASSVLKFLVKHACKSGKLSQGNFFNIPASHNMEKQQSMKHIYNIKY